MFISYGMLGMLRLSVAKKTPKNIAFGASVPLRQKIITLEIERKDWFSNRRRSLLLPPFQRISPTEGRKRILTTGCAGSMSCLLLCGRFVLRMGIPDPRSEDLPRRWR